MSRFYRLVLYAICLSIILALTAISVRAGVIAAPHSHGVGGPEIDASAIPAGDPGLSVDKVQPTDEQPADSKGGAFRTVCKFSHMAFDDPIVFPNQPGKSHLHAIFGNTGTNAFSTAESIATTGNSTCRGGTVNRTAYWVPAMIDTRTGAPVKPSDSNFYYKSGGMDPASIQPLPPGLRMIAGDAKASGPQSVPVWFSCSRWTGNFKDLVSPKCQLGESLMQWVSFPQCWDGRNLDSPDHKSHMAYSVGKACPATHPVALPEITLSIVYRVTELDEPTHWRLSSDTYPPHDVAGAPVPGGYSSHGDWFNGWKRDISDAWVKGCLNASKDCHSHLSGDGRKFSF